MGKLIWLASYPKSGNTWLRAFLHNLMRNPDEAYDINRLTDFTLSDAQMRWYQLFDPRPGPQISKEEVAALRSELARLPGIKDLSFDILNRRMSVSHLDTDVTVADIVAAVAETGMSAELWTDAASGNLPDVGWSRWGPTAFTVASGLLLAAGLLSHLAIGGIAALGDTHTDHAVPWSIRMLYGLSVVVGAWFVVPKGLRALRRLRPDMNLLMLIAVSGAVVIGEWFEAAAVAFLFSLSLLLESWSVGRARRAIASLMDLSPPTVRLCDETGEESEVPPAEVAIRDAGAYSFAMASEYNGRPLPAEVFVVEGRVQKVSPSPGRNSWVTRRLEA